MRSFSLTHVDTCFSDYLTDHHNRDGEALFGVTVGRSEDDAAEALLEEIQANDCVPEDLDAAMLMLEIKPVVAGVDWRTIDPASGDPVDGLLPEDCDEEQPSAWFLLKWDAS